MRRTMPAFFRYNMPRVVSNQRETFESDDLLRRLSGCSDVRYTGFRDKPMAERRQRFRDGCVQGQTEISYLNCGFNLPLSLVSNSWSEDDSYKSVTQEFVDFQREANRVHLKSQFILNGVCVIWRGYIDLNTLDGNGRLEFDTERAQAENERLRMENASYQQRLDHFEDGRGHQQPNYHQLIQQQQQQQQQIQLQQHQEQQHHHQQHQLHHQHHHHSRDSLADEEAEVVQALLDISNDFPPA